jgi:hypothetical protein
MGIISWAQTEHKFMHLPSIICWVIWLERNNAIFYNGTPSTSATAYKALGIFNSWNDSHASKASPHRTLKIPELDDITMPWFDGAVLSNGL